MHSHDAKWVRDPDTGALLASNKAELDLYKLQRDSDVRITSLENDISDIKSMLQTLINNQK